MTIFYFLALAPGEQSAITFTPDSSGIYFFNLSFDGKTARPDPDYSFDLMPDAEGQLVEAVIIHADDSTGTITGVQISDDPTIGSTNPLCVTHGENTDLSAMTYLNLGDVVAGVGTAHQYRDFAPCSPIPEPGVSILILLAACYLLTRRTRTTDDN